jgi:hypothetical protein
MGERVETGSDDRCGGIIMGVDPSMSEGSPVDITALCCAVWRWAVVCAV